MVCVLFAAALCIGAFAIANNIFAPEDETSAVTDTGSAEITTEVTEAITDSETDPPTEAITIEAPTEKEYTFESEPTNTSNSMPICNHGAIYGFDDETMTVKTVYEGNLIEDFLYEIEYYGDKAIVLDGGFRVTEGELQEGMIVQIFHGDELYGEYTIAALLKPFPGIQD